MAALFVYNVRTYVRTYICLHFEADPWCLSVICRRAMYLSRSSLIMAFEGFLCRSVSQLLTPPSSRFPRRWDDFEMPTDNS